MICNAQLAITVGGGRLGRRGGVCDTFNRKGSPRIHPPFLLVDLYNYLIDFAWEASPSPAIEKKECVWGIPDETSDVVLEVEGRELHANRAVLAHYSPVFGRMFFSDFREKEQNKVPLPGKSYDEMANFFTVLYPQTPTSPDLITGNGVLDRILPVHNAFELLKPVLNWAKCLFAEHTSNSSTNYDLFLN